MKSVLSLFSRSDSTSTESTPFPRHVGVTYLLPEEPSATLDLSLKIVVEQLSQIKALQVKKRLGWNIWNI
jgi:hypothetical protein